MVESQCQKSPQALCLPTQPFRCMKLLYNTPNSEPQPRPLCDSHVTAMSPETPLLWVLLQLLPPPELLPMAMELPHTGLRCHGCSTIFPKALLISVAWLITPLIALLSPLSLPPHASTKAGLLEAFPTSSYLVLPVTLRGKHCAV
jgi:hypothetical protein